MATFHWLMTSAISWLLLIRTRSRATGFWFSPPACPPSESVLSTIRPITLRGTQAIAIVETVMVTVEIGLGKRPKKGSGLSCHLRLFGLTGIEPLFSHRQDPEWFRIRWFSYRARSPSARSARKKRRHCSVISFIFWRIYHVPRSFEWLWSWRWHGRGNA